MSLYRAPSRFFVEADKDELYAANFGAIKDYPLVDDTFMAVDCAEGIALDSFSQTIH